MKKILRYFPLNKFLRYENRMSLLKVIGIYWGTAIGFSMVHTVTRWIPLIKNLTLRASNFYTYYILVGCALAVAQYFMKTEQDEICYVTLEDVKYLWGIDKVKKGLLIAMAVLCILPTGSKKNYAPVVEETTVQIEQQAENEISETEKVEVETEIEKETEIETEKLKKELEEFYGYARGFWKNEEIHYTFTKKGDSYIFFDSNSVGDKMTNENFYIADYSLTDYKKSEAEITVELKDTEGMEYDVVIAYDGDKGNKMQIRKKGDSEWIELENNNCYSFLDLLEKDNYTVYFCEDKGYDGTCYRYIRKREYIKNDSKYCYLECFDYFEGEELIVNRSVSTYIWGMNQGMVVPLIRLDGNLQEARYDAENGFLWDYMWGAYGHEGSYTRWIYNTEKDSWSDDTKGESSLEGANLKPLVLCRIDEIYEEVYQKEMQKYLEEEMIKNFAVDESMIITTPLEDYEGVYSKKYGSIYINGVSEDILTVNHTEESNYTIYGILARQTEGYPEGTAVYGGTVSAKGRNGHTGSFEGQIFIVLQPNGNIFIKHFSGDMIYQEGFFTKTGGKPIEKWKVLYSEVVKEHRRLQEEPKYQLVYMDQDDIPELWIYLGGQFGMDDIYTIVDGNPVHILQYDMNGEKFDYLDGEVVSLRTASVFSDSYFEKSGIYFNHFVDMDGTSWQGYRLRNGRLEYIFDYYGDAREEEGAISRIKYKKQDGTIVEESGLSSDLIKILEAEYGISFENNIWVSSLYEEAMGYDEFLNYLNSN